MAKGGGASPDVSVQYGRYRLAADGERLGSADHDPPCVVGCQAIVGRDARLSIRGRGYKTGSRRCLRGRKYLAYIWQVAVA